jgi:dihydrofolate reductase
MIIKAIVAIDRNGAIGKGGKLPWHYSADLKFFKGQTTGHVCVMGRRTWLSLAKPLPNRLNVVLTRSSPVGARSGLISLPDKQSVLSLAPYLNCDLFVIGGRQIFDEFAPEIDEWIVTHVPLAVEHADTFMSPGFLEGYALRESRELDDDLKVTFHTRPR